MKISKCDSYHEQHIRSHCNIQSIIHVGLLLHNSIWYAVSPSTIFSLKPAINNVNHWPYFCELSSWLYNTLYKVHIFGRLYHIKYALPGMQCGRSVRNNWSLICLLLHPSYLTSGIFQSSVSSGALPRRVDTLASCEAKFIKGFV